MNFKIQAICVAYEQGYGDGLDNRTKPNPYEPGSDTAYAWDYGYSEGIEKARLHYGVKGSPLLSHDEINTLCEKIAYKTNKPRAFSTISGGVLDYITDTNVDFASFDFDDFKECPESLHNSIPDRFKDLAEQMGVPEEAFEDYNPLANSPTSNSI